MLRASPSPGPWSRWLHATTCAPARRATSPTSRSASALSFPRTTPSGRMSAAATLSPSRRSRTPGSASLGFAFAGAAASAAGFILMRDALGF